MANRKRILIADDDPDLRELMSTDLATQDYETLLAVNGEEALEIALRERPDVILLDVMMPKIDGYHVAYELTTKLGANAPKIIIITSRDTLREKGVALMSGAVSILQKPFGITELRQKITDTLAGRS